MATTVEANDAAYAWVETAIQKMANVLEFTYIKSTDRSTTRPTGPLQRYCFRIAPHAYGIFAFKHVELVCIADMSALTFYEYVNERFGTEREPIPKARGTSIVLDAELLARKDIRLPNDLAMVLSYAPTSPERCFGEDRFSVNKSATDGSAPLSKLYDSQQLQLAERKTYLKLRHWAYQCGIFSPDIPLLTEECLQYLLAAAQSQVPGSYKHNLRNHVWTIHDHLVVPFVAPSGRIILDSKNRNLQWITKTLSWARRPLRHGDNLELTNDASRWISFKDSHADFVNISVRWWVAKKEQEAVSTLLGLSTKLQNHIGKCYGDPTSVTIWPHLSKHDDCQTSMILGITSAERKCDFAEFLSRQQYDTSAFQLWHEQLWRPDLQPTDYVRCDDPMINFPTADPIQSQSQSPAIGPTGGRFRTAAAVIHRLQHDPAHASQTYEIGYVDRFEDSLVWKALDKWEKFTEEEEFVPEHRVRQVRRKADGMVVWDREKRYDGT